MGRRKQTPDQTKAAVEKNREAAGLYSLDRSAKGRDIGPPPPIADVERRLSCRKSLRLFCETYNPAAFTMGWSDDHLKMIARIEESVFLGALFAFAMPRGSGKSTICRMAALWATSYVHCRYFFLIGATAAKAEDTLDALKMFIRFLPDYSADFPEVSYPTKRLEGIAHRATGQICCGESTMIEWSKDRIVYPTVPVPENWPEDWPKRSDGKALTSGVVLGTAGLTGEGIRGSLLTLNTGEQVRPDFVLLDDPQTSESAGSPIQNIKRLRLVSADVLGMAGPGKSLAAVMPCTVIENGDMIDEILDRSKHPLWRGERTKMLRSFPTNRDVWDEYFEIYNHCAQREPPDYADANAHYEMNRTILEEGAEASWSERKQDWELSAIQSAMHLYSRDRKGFMSEYQNSPEKESFGEEAKELIPAHVAERTNGSERFKIPRGYPTLTAFFDVGIHLHWYLVAAWNESFGGCVVDYGCWPRQNRSLFEAMDARPSLRDTYPGRKDDQLVYAGLMDMTAEVLGKRYASDQTGGEVMIERALVDSGEQTVAVHKFVKASPFRSVLMASKGFGRSATSSSVQDWKRREGEKRGHYWRMTLADADNSRTVQFDTDEWKSQVYAMLTIPVGGKTGLTLWGEKDRKDLHQLFGIHCSAEYSTPVFLPTKGVKFNKWANKPKKIDNHLWDCIIGSAVAASVNGVKFSVSGKFEEAKPKKKIDIEALYAKANSKVPA